MNDDDHLKVINRTRSLFPADLDIDSEKIVEKLSSFMGTSLSFNNSLADLISQPIVVRLNRPNILVTTHIKISIMHLMDLDMFLKCNVWIPIWCK